MQAAQMTPKTLGEAVGISVQAISQVMSGRSGALAASNCVRAARTLGVDAFWLATGEGAMQPTKKPQTVSLSSQETELAIAMRVLSDYDRDAFAAQIRAKARVELDRLREILDSPSNKSHSR